MLVLWGLILMSLEAAGLGPSMRLQKNLKEESEFPGGIFVELVIEVAIVEVVSRRLRRFLKVS